MLKSTGKTKSNKEIIVEYLKAKKKTVAEKIVAPIK